MNELTIKINLYKNRKNINIADLLFCQDTQKYVHFRNEQVKGVLTFNTSLSAELQRVL